MDLFGFLKKRRNDPKKHLKEILKGYELPSFPGAVMKVINMLRDPDSPMNEIADLIKSDPGMHVMVLKTVNSAAFGLTRKVSNIQQATTLMGRSRLESLILPMGVKNVMPRIKDSYIDMKTFWLTSARRACLADQVASLIHPTTKMESFTAGLLQDMAIPVLIDVAKGKYNKTLEKWHGANDLHLPELEQDAHGYDHQSVGALMAVEWNLPEYLVDSIMAHHVDGEKCVQPAVYVVSDLRYREMGDEPIEKFTSTLLADRLGLKEKTIDDMVRVAFDNAKEFASIMC